MSYFDERIYNSKNLHDEDKRIIRGADIIMRDLLRNEAADCGIALENNPSTLERIQIEERLNLLKQLWENYKVERLEMIVSFIDNYDDPEFTDEQVEAGEPDDLGDFEDVDA